VYTISPIYFSFQHKTRQLDLFKSRSLSGFLIYLGGPVHWVSKQQAITACSSAEAEIYAADECTKYLLQTHQIVDGLDLTLSIMPLPTTIFNDNSDCINWSKNLTTKGLCHIQICENAVQESTQNRFIIVKHCPGKTNLSNMFTKEDKNTPHFIEIRNLVMSDRKACTTPFVHRQTVFDLKQGGGCRVGIPTLASPPKNISQ
jgi:hypothetical protein